MGFDIGVHVYFKNYWIWQLVLDGVVEIDVAYEANDSGSKQFSSSVYLFAADKRSLQF